jgi:hypothetical protein
MPTTVTFRGNFFSTDNQRTVRAAINDIVRDVTAETERRVKTLGQSSFRYVHKTYDVPGKWLFSVRSTLSGNEGIVDDGGIVYGPWLEGVGSRNATTRFKGYRMWRRTAQQMQRGGAEKIAQPIVDRAVRELNA